MLEAISVGGYKSYGAVQRLPLAPLTVLIGANASGKSNLIEALQLLSWMAEGRRLGGLSHAMSTREIAVRGSTTDLPHRAKDPVALGAELSDSLRLAMELDINGRGPRVHRETMTVRGTDYYRVREDVAGKSGELIVAYHPFVHVQRQPVIECVDQRAVFTQLDTPARFAANDREAQEAIPAAALRLYDDLRNVLYLDPRPDAMRGYSNVDETALRSDGSNLSSVLRYICEQAGSTEDVLAFVRALPEQDIEGIDFLVTERRDVMLSLVESFGGVKERRYAAVLSDGTLRVLAIAAAIVSMAPNGLVVVEEIDNGVHPSRAKQLMKLVAEQAEKRSIKILLTTHNPALLDAVPDAALGDTVACYRDPQSGQSRLRRLADMDDFAEIAVQGSLGWLAESGLLDRYLKHAKTAEQRARDAQSTLDLLRSSGP